MGSRVYDDDTTISTVTDNRVGVGDDGTIAGGNVTKIGDGGSSVQGSTITNNITTTTVSSDPAVLARIASDGLDAVTRISSDGADVIKGISGDAISILRSMSGDVTRISGDTTDLLKRISGDNNDTVRSISTDALRLNESAGDVLKRISGDGTDVLKRLSGDTTNLVQRISDNDKDKLSELLRAQSKGLSDSLSMAERTAKVSIDASNDALSRGLSFGKDSLTFARDNVEDVLRYSEGIQTRALQGVKDLAGLVGQEGDGNRELANKLVSGVLTAARSADERNIDSFLNAAKWIVGIVAAIMIIPQVVKVR